MNSTLVRSAPVVLVIENDVTCPPALVGEWLRESGVELRVIAAHAGDPLPLTVPDDVDAVLPLGGVVGANDDHVAPWLPAERALLADATSRGVPVFGICLGGQLLAAATGGRVEVSEATEIGVSEVSRTMDGHADPVTGALVPMSGDTVPAAQWHLDRITRLPDDAVLLMTNDACPVQAFRLGEVAYGLQMHPEVDQVIFEDWAKDVGTSVPRTTVTPAEAVRTFEARANDLTRAWRPAVEAWAALVWKRARSLGTVAGP